MSKMTEKSRPSGIPLEAGQLIERIKALKEIKPRKEWAVLLKSQILAGEQTEFLEQPARFAGFANIFSQRKMAYAFSVVLLLIVGVFGAIKLLPTTNIPQQTASLTGQAVLKQNVEALNIKINNLSNTTKANKVAINDINANVSALAKTLAKTPTKDPASPCTSVYPVVEDLYEQRGRDDAPAFLRSRSLGRGSSIRRACRV